MQGAGTWAAKAYNPGALLPLSVLLLDGRYVMQEVEDGARTSFRTAEGRSLVPAVLWLEKGPVVDGVGGAGRRGRGGMRGMCLLLRGC
ncbi:hypothetical protein DACRYDRAFT_25546 [Dacryopinax primogenitus]|uniref:Uncharacterized protein n=1 Tax=Dacryopinax primogenitus (strain DJM 731) TaxID=1858805 RepID=M5FN29_DACPD|nr:uncharacterized protein DACRYDRAFT_25546 [Dacryopinax primogenitus]EJT96725.1 hypothetical protein DACRYDRAFT_25546 [Dacryopinax primogenitus]